jgi:hypothetical protein
MTPYARTVRLLLGALTLLASSGCSLQSRAVTAASEAWSCPEDGIQVVSADADAPNGAAPQPPADIAAGCTGSALRPLQRPSGWTCCRGRG